MVGSLFISILEYLLVTVIILDAGSPYGRAVNVDYHLPEICAVLIVVLFALRARRIKKGVLRKYAACIIPYFVITILYMIVSVKTDRMIGFGARFLILIPVGTFLFLQYIEIHKPYQLLQKYVNVMTFLAIVSLFFWIFGSQIRIIKPTGHLTAHWGTDYPYPSWFGLYFERQYASVFGISFGMRNQGIFAEGPMYSLNLVFSIAICMFLIPRDTSKARWSQAILGVTLFTTFTTTGFILLVLIISLKILRKGRRKGFVRLIFIVFGIPLTIWVMGTVYLDKATSISWLIRLDDFKAGLYAWRQHPFFGSGWSDRTLTIQFMSSFRANSTGYSNTIMQILSEGGLCLFSIYAVPIVGVMVKSLIQKQRNISLFMMIFLLEFIFTIFTYFLLMIFFISMLYAIFINGKELDRDSLNLTKV